MRRISFLSLSLAMCASAALAQQKSPAKKTKPDKEVKAADTVWSTFFQSE